MDRRIPGELVLAAVLGSVAVLGACTTPATDEERLSEMLLTPDDLGETWVVNAEADDGILPELGPPCAQAPAGAAGDLAGISWTVIQQLRTRVPPPEPETASPVFLMQVLTAGDPAALSAAVAVESVCPPPSSTEFPDMELIPPVRVPVSVGDEAVVWRTGLTFKGSDEILHDWHATVRIRDVLISLSITAVRHSGEPAPNDEIAIDIISAAANKVG